MSTIRRITIGPDFKNAMTYTVGQSVMDNSHTIKRITRDELMEVRVLVEKNGTSEVFAWKTFNRNMPISIEHNINF